MGRRLSRFGQLLASNLLEAELRATLAREEVTADCGPLLSWIGWIHPDRPLTPEFRRVLDSGRVRGADLWHLACALYLKDRLHDLAFVSLDRTQRRVTEALGFEPLG